MKYTVNGSSTQYVINVYIKKLVLNQLTLGLLQVSLISNSRTSLNEVHTTQQSVDYPGLMRNIFSCIFENPDSPQKLKKNTNPNVADTKRLFIDINYLNF